MAEAPLASPHEMIAFHTREYLQALARWEWLPRRRREQHGLEDDCAPFPGCEPPRRTPRQQLPC